MSARRPLALLLALVLPAILSCGGDSGPSGPGDSEDAPAVATVAVTPSDLHLQLGDTSRLAVVIADAEGTVLSDRPVQWSSEDPGVASVSDEGLVTAEGPGTTEVVVATEGVADTAMVEVLREPPGPGEIAWSFNVAGEMANGGTPAVGPDGAIYVTSFTGDGSFLYALSPNGTLRWRSEAGSIFTPIVGPDGTVYTRIGLRDEHNVPFDRTLALDPDGNEIWHVDHHDVAAVTADGTVYFHHGPRIREPDGTIRRLTEESVGGILWAVMPDGSALMTNRFTDTNIATLVGLDGTIRWRYENPPGRGHTSFTTDPMLYMGAAVDQDGSVVFTSSTQEHAQRIFRLSPSGRLLWERNWYHTSNCRRISPPVIGPDGTIYVGVRSSLYALEPDGTTKWRYNLEGGQEWAPAVSADGMIYATIDAHPSRKPSGSVYALNEEGHRQWGEVEGNLDFCRGTNTTVTPTGLVLVSARNRTRLDAYVGSGPLASGVWPKAQGDAGNTSSR